MEYLTTGEQKAVRKIVKTARASGFLISIWEGEDWAIRRSDNEAEILKALGSTGQDRIDFVRPPADQSEKPTRAGWVLLVYGNNPDGSEVVADARDNEVTNLILSQ
ncbi:hypothetical protein [Gluconobacter cerinus]|uniref:hypothetical protein n=1 Tax=Gluconobacter cerinus TaxID=38307 RepID=UPI001B8D3A80|nr:hypothetical protein [Gluconobacter cerinus]MBS0984253.1 hypothetical protein [Gluconobacter cerinus]